MSLLLSSIAVTLGLSYAILGSSSEGKEQKQISRAHRHMMAALGKEEDKGCETDESVDGSPGVLDSFGKDDGESPYVIKTLLKLPIDLIISHISLF